MWARFNALAVYSHHITCIYATWCFILSLEQDSYPGLSMNIERFQYLLDGHDGHLIIVYGAHKDKFTSITGICWGLNKCGYPCKRGINTLRPRQNGRRFADDTFKRIFWNENVRISIKISLKFVPKGPINNNPALVLFFEFLLSASNTQFME